jgi:hypothetical protein
MKREGSRALVIALAAVSLVLALAVYIAGYFLLGTGTYHSVISYDGGPEMPARERGYNSNALVWLFKPAAAVESVLTGAEVTTSFDLPNP